MESNTTAVSLRGVTKTYGDHRAVNGVDLSVPKGSIYGFIGPNGSGKTTTIRMILNIIQADQGEIEVLGETERRAANDRIGYLPEERGLYRKMSVLRVLKYFGSIRGLSQGEARRRAEGWLEKMGLGDWSGKKVETLSKGMAQKVQFISAVIAKPELLILDEPFSGLDPVNLEVIRKAVLELNMEGTTVIFSTHDMSAAERMCDSIFMIHRGEKVLDGPMETVKNDHGADLIRIKWGGTVAQLKGFEGVELVRDLGRMQEVRMAGDSQRLLEMMVGKNRVELFEVAEPSLHDIFVGIAGEEGQK
jgi:ABC-2 type transport system ATP-binding protein